MCGIVGYAGKNGNSLKVLIDGLHNLEYRGYDSSGICILKDNDIYIEKEKGRITLKLCTTEGDIEEKTITKKEKEKFKIAKKLNNGDILK